MNLADFINHLASEEVTLWLDSGRLRYRAPRGTLSPDLLDQIRQRKSELIEHLHARAASTRTYPLSFSQRGVWSIERLAPGNAAYHVAVGIRIRGTLDASILERSIHAVIDRHDPLRTAILLEDDGPVQQVTPRVPFRLRLTDLQELPASERKPYVEQSVLDETRVPFELSDAPLLRGTLFQLAPQDHVLALILHHIICDGHSVAIFTADLVKAYESIVSGGSSSLPELPVKYGDLAIRERTEFDGEHRRRLEAHWKQVLEGNLPVLELPTDHPRPPVQSFEGAEYGLPGSQSLKEALEELSTREGVTLFTTLVAAFSTLLGRYTGQDDILLGAPSLNRESSDSREMIGMFVNSLVLRTDLSGNPRFTELLRRVRTVTLNALEHQGLPFETIVEQLRPHRDASRNPLFQVFINLIDTTRGEQTLLDREFKLFPFQSAGAQFDLALQILNDGTGLTFQWRYDTALFEESTIRRTAGHFRTLLEALLRDPVQRISTAPYLHEQERTRILEEWNATDKSWPSDLCVHELFERQAHRTPDVVAIRFEKDALTYRELNEEANRLAKHLKRLGVERETLVGICLDRSLDLAIGLLGILKAGGAYVPLDPGFPDERLAFMIKDSQASFLLTHSGRVRGLPPFHGEVVCLEQASAAIAAQSTENPLDPSPTDGRAYVIYTSGSTGTPNGVEISHASLVNFLHSMSERPGMTNRDTLLAVTTVSFDIAALELFLPLIVGGETVIARADEAADGARLSQRLLQCGATVLQATPATWRLLLDAGWEGSRQIRALCGGESLSRQLADRLLERTGELWNLYGPTETTIWSTVKKVAAGEPIQLGKPIDNTQVYILDPALQPVPVGVRGELYIGGSGLARGYLHRSELTRDRFIPHPFRCGERLYRTGDVARYLANGEIEYLGRQDRQVKVRGFRVELGEIESVMNSHQHVEQSAVVVRWDTPEDARLVGYFVVREAKDISPRELRHLLSNKLPQYMVPSDFVQLHEMPLTPNGKVDRRSLPAPGTELSRSGEAEYVAPRCATELCLVGLWEKVLRRHPIGITDDFFELGGHSVLASRLFALIEKTMGVNVPLATLLHDSTIEGLSQSLQRQDWTSSWSSVVPIQPGGSRRPFFCIHAAEGNILIYRNLALHLGDDQPVYGLQAKGLDGKAPTLSTFEELAARYVDEIKTVQPEGPYHLGGYCLGGTLAYEIAQQLRANGDEVRLLALFETYNVRPLITKLSASRFLQLRHLVQNLRYHWLNVGLASRRQKLRFLREKVDVQSERIRLRLSDVLRSTLDRLGLSRSRNRLISNAGLAAAHHRAQWNYEPKPYPGRVVLFRPRGAYSGLEDSDYGWGELTPVKTRVLPVYPRGMMTGSFAATLARELREVLDQLDAAESSGLGDLRQRDESRASASSQLSPPPIEGGSSGGKARG